MIKNSFMSFLGEFAESLSECIIMLDDESVIRYLNSKICYEIGCDAGSTIGSNFSSILAVKFDKSLLELGTYITLFFLTKDNLVKKGKFKFFEYNESGKHYIILNGYITYNDNIPFEWNRLNLNDKLMNSIPIPLSITTVDDGIIIDANRYFLDYFEYSEFEVVGKKSSELNIYVDKKIRLQLLEEITRNGCIINNEIQYRTKTGKEKNGILYATRFSIGDKSYHICTITDITERNSLESALRKNEEYQRLFTEHMNDVIWAIDLQYNKTFTSNSISTFLGYSVEEFNTMPFNELLEDKSYKKFLFRLNGLRDMASNSEIPNRQVMELEFIARDKSLIWGEINFSFAYDSTGCVQGFQGITRNITVRKKLEKVLSDSYNEINTAISCLDDLILKADTNLFLKTVYNWGNENIKLLIKGNNTYQREIQNVFSSEFVDIILESIVFKPTSHKLPYKKEFVVSKNNETYCYVLIINLLVDDSNKPTDYIIIVKDKTNDYRLQQLLKEQVAFSQMLIDSTPLPIYYRDFSGKVLGCNSYFEKLTTLSKNEIVGSNIYEIFKICFPEELENINKLKTLNYGVKPLEMNVTSHDGVSNYVLYKSYIYNTENVSEGIIVAMLDVTSIKNMEAQLKKEQLLKLLEQTERIVSLGVVAEGIAHEINQPLNAIKILVDGAQILTESGYETITSEDLKTISQQVVRISNTIKQIDKLTRQNKIMLNETFDVNESIATAVTLLNSKLVENNVSIELFLCNEKCFVSSQPNQLEQAFVNLLNYSIKYLDAKKTEAENIIKFITFQKNNNVFIEFVDEVNDVSVSPDTIFDPFNDESLGLGLPIVKNIIDKMDGTIYVENFKPAGRKFTIILPRKSEVEL